MELIVSKNVYRICKSPNSLGYYIPQVSLKRNLRNEKTNVDNFTEIFITFEVTSLQ